MKTNAFTQIDPRSDLGDAASSVVARSSGVIRTDAGRVPTMPARTVHGGGVAADRAARAGPNGAASAVKDGAADAAAVTDSGDRAVGRTPICRRPTTPSPGSRDGYRRLGSPTSR